MTWARAVTLLVLSAALLIALSPALTAMPEDLAAPAALVVLALGLWATGALPLHLTALLLFVLVTVLGLAPPAVIFAGFTATGLWLVFGGLVIAAAIEDTGLAGRFARLVVARLQGSYRRVIYGTVLIALAMAFLVPAAMGRIVIMLPIFQALAREVGLPPRSNGAIGIALAVAFGSFLPAFAILPANLPNMVLLGAMETVYGVGITYGAYLLLHFPLLGLAKALLLAELICRLFPDQTRSPERAEPGQPETPWSAAERRLLVILVAALGLWASDWLHGISAGWIALLAALACLLPGVGVLAGTAFEQRVPFATFLYVAGLLGMVRLIDASGLGDALGGFLLEQVPFRDDAPASSFAALVGINAVTGMMTALAGLPAVMTPIAAPIAAASGLPLESVLMVQVIGFSLLLLPYQSAPLMVALQIGRVPLAQASKLSLTLAAATLLLLVPASYGWWRLLGYLP